MGADRDEPSSDRPAVDRARRETVGADVSPLHVVDPGGERCGREVLETAYQGGFFRSPRVRGGEELAGTLGIAPSTFSYHLREGERQLAGLVFVRLMPEWL